MPLRMRTACGISSGSRSRSCAAPPESRKPRRDALGPPLSHPRRESPLIVLRGGFQADPTELRQFVQKHLADYKVPEKFILPAAMPKSHTSVTTS